MSEKIEKGRTVEKSRSDAAKDIDLINRYAARELSPEDVYVFDVALCNNDVDRDMERFTDESLRALAEMFVGKTGIRDHFASADNQCARLYKTWVETDPERLTALGGAYKQLMGSAYMVRDAGTNNLIAKIEGGILKEVSVSCSIGRVGCSICGEGMKYSWERGWVCGNDHIKGQTYAEGLCVGELEDPKDAYEFSFVAIPAQPEAGVRKGAEDVSGAVRVLMEADLSGHLRELAELAKKIAAETMAQEERERRARIARENEAFL